MKRVLVSGAAGFIGANLVRRLLADGHEVHALVRPQSDLWRLRTVLEDIRLLPTDLESEESVGSAVRKARPDWIFHVAAYGAYPFQTDLGRMLRTNVLGTVNLVRACLRRDFEAFVNAGSSSEYGLKDHAPKEDELLEPNSHYGVTKASATLFCQHTARHEAVHLPTLRFYSVYGPWEQPSRLIPSLISRGLRKQFPPLVSPDIARDFVYVDDALEACCLAASSSGQTPGAIYNVGSGKQTSLGDTVELARRVFQIEEVPQWGSLPSRSWDTNVWVADNEKIRRALGWGPKHDFERGFRETARWLSESPELRSRYLSEISSVGTLPTR